MACFHEFGGSVSPVPGCTGIRIGQEAAGYGPRVGSGIVKVEGRVGAKFAHVVKGLENVGCAWDGCGGGTGCWM